MYPNKLAAISLALVSASTVLAQTTSSGGSTTTRATGASTPTPAPTSNPTGSNVPLVSRRFEYTALPYKVDTGDGERGTQQGYNRCNSTTENQQSLCQTGMINSLDDFCLWGGVTPNQIVGDVEGEMIAWCTKPGRGTRLIPPGALTGVQFMRTPDYVQVTGHIKQELINIAANDDGGELDPIGADRRGNPLGGVVYSNAFPSNGGNNNTYQQVQYWHNFMGANVFCFKACDPTGPNAAKFCEHVYDRIGCAYNAPAAYLDNVFLSCLGENQDFPGIYTDASGAVQTYRQPPENLGPIQTVPYDPKIPASSNCVTYSSSALYASLATAFPSSSSAGPTTSAGSATTSGSASNAGSSSASATASPSGNAAAGLTTPSVVGMAFWSSMAVVMGGLALGVATL